MCLFSVRKTYEIGESGFREGWKVFMSLDHRLLPLHGTLSQFTRDRCIRMNKWYYAQTFINRNITTDRRCYRMFTADGSGTDYLSGFHIYLTRDIAIAAAEIARRMVFWPSTVIDVAQVSYRQVVAEGYDMVGNESVPTDVAMFMRVDKVLS